MVGHGSGEPFPLLGEDASDITGQPLDLATRASGNESQHQSVDPLPMFLGIGQSECCSPGQTQDGPGFHPKLPTEGFDVGNEMGGGVGAEVGIRVTGQGPAAPGPTLVEQDGAVHVGIEETSLARRAARTGPSVEIERGFPFMVATTLPIDPMSVTHVQHSRFVWIERRESAQFPSPRRAEPTTQRHYSRTRSDRVAPAADQTLRVVRMVDACRNRSQAGGRLLVPATRHGRRRQCLMKRKSDRRPS